MTGSATTPASAIQEQMWLGEMIRGSDTVYTMTELLRVGGVLDADRLTAAIGVLVERHEALRTIVYDDGTSIVQHVLADCPIPLEQVILDPAGDHEREFRGILKLAMAEPFALLRPPLWRCLFGVTDEVSYLAIVMHHIVADGWSLDLMLDELEHAYRELPAPAPTPTYRDFADMETAWLAGAAADEARQYWRRHLAGAPATSTFPGPGVHSAHRGEQLDIAVPEDVAHRVHDIAAKQFVTPYMVYLAAYALLLARWCGRPDVVVGVPAANREPEEFAGTVGLFVNPLPVRIRLAGELTLTAAIDAVLEALLGALEHQRLPFRHVLHEADRERIGEADASAASSPLFQTMMAERTAPDADAMFDGHPVRRSAGYTGTAKYDLMLSCPPSGSGEDGRGLIVEYDLGRYDRLFIQRLAAEYLEILAEPFDGVPVDAARPEPEVTTLGQLIRLAGRLGGNRVAVVQGSAWISYGDLLARATRVADALVGSGTGRNTIVGILLMPGIDFATMAIAVAMAGAAYLPMSPDWPAQRVRQALTDAAAVMLVAGSTTAAESGYGVPAYTPAQLLAIGANAEAVNEVPIHPDDLAMVIYTSGSTGRPKGVMVTHGSVAQLVSPAQIFAVQPGDRVAQHANLAFDATTWELWGTIRAGATLVYPQMNDLGPPEYAAFFSTCTAVLITSGLFTELMRHEACRDAARGLRLVIVGGDVLNPSAAAAIGPSGSHRFNVYGPTEATVFTTMGPMAARSDRGTIPIGTPLDGWSCCVLDEHLDPVSPGQQGELYIRGIGVARGYIGRPALTAARFVPDPTTPGRRMYATGDLVVTLPDGAFDFVGRSDDQIKIRGFRVELGEIESVLRDHPDVIWARVLTDRSGAENDLRLTAVVQAAVTNQERLVSQLRRSLRSRLPNFMQPHELSVVDHLPLTENGKVDLRKIAASSTVPPVAVPAAAAPSMVSSTERMAVVWREVLRVQVAADADFFALGGDSLAALRLLIAVEATFGVRLRPIDVFTHPRLESFHSLVAGSTEMPTPTPVRRAGGVPLAHAQRRLWMLSQLEPASPAYHVPVAFRLSGALDSGALAAAVADLVQRHEILRTVFPQTPDGTLQMPLADRTTWPALVEQATDAARWESDLVRAATRPFQLEVDVPMRATLFRIDAVDHILLLCMHHVAVDGTSVALLISDLNAAYACRISGRTLPVGAAPKYTDYTLWHNSMLGAEDDPDSILGRHRSYWLETLRDLPAQTGLPIDRIRSAEAGLRGSRIPVSVPADLADRLADIARSTGTTMFMVLHTAFAVLLQGLGAASDIVIGSPVTGRVTANSLDLVGCLVNTVVLRADLTGNPTFVELLARIRNVDVAAFDHQDFPFDLLVDALAPPRSLAWHPLFQILFAYQDGGEPTLTLPGADARRVPVNLGAAQFDLALHLLDRHGTGPINGFVEYRDDLFDRVTVDAAVERLSMILDAFVKDPKRRIGEVRLISDHEQRTVLTAGRGRVKPAGSSTLPELVEAQSLRTPSATAVVCEESSMSYLDLNARANRVAHRLIADGIGPENVVAISLPRSLELVIAILAVMKAGAAYLPIDPELPGERIEYLLAASGARICLDDPAAIETGSNWPDHNPTAVSVYAQHPAYVIYTSGSTGDPKGVVVPHAGIVNRLMGMQAEFVLRTDDRVLQKTPASFDVSVWEFFWPLVTGATLVMARPDGHRDPRYLAQTIRAQSITTIHFVPSMLRAFLTEPSAGNTPSLRRVICSGEALPVDLVNAAHAVLSCDLVNLYGPTEASIDVTSWTCERHGGLRRNIPIGRPATNCRVYVMDEYLRLLPTGTPGDLYLAGAQLARGYLAQPGLTATQFIPDPVTGDGERMYRTGDRARWTSEGVLEFLGRSDDQVKLRGIRIEPGELAASLMALPEIGAAVAVVREDRPGFPALVAYVVPAPGATLDPDDLRTVLTRRLPSYLLPEAIVLLADLPLGRAGKIDRRALPAPVSHVSSGEPPATSTEVTIAGLVADLLRISSPSRTDDFFHLGGTSLTAIELVAAIRATLGVDLPLRALFQVPTVAGIAAAIAPGDGHARISPLDLTSKTILDADVTVADRTPADRRRAAAPDRIVLTGATGFLGAFLLRRLLDRTPATVTCLVRAADPGSAARRIEENLRRYGLWDPRVVQRIDPVPADLAVPLLGLSRRAFDELATSADVIYHNGARVNVVEPYATLAPVNVGGTHELVRLAASGRPTPIHYISTSSTMSASGYGGLFAANAVPDSGYVQSKWVAEALVREGFRRGLPGAIYRPSRISGDSVTGASATGDAFWVFIRACVELGAVPTGGGWWTTVDLVPVDRVAALIVDLASEQPLDGSYLLLPVQPIRLSEVLDRLRKAGYRITEIDPADWDRRLTEGTNSWHTDRGRSLAAISAIRAVLGASAAAEQLSEDQSDQGDVRSGTVSGNHRPDAGRLDFDVRHLSLDERVIDRYIEYFQSCGFLPFATTASKSEIL